MHTVFPENMEITKEGILVTRKRKICRWHRNSNINANHSSICIHHKSAGIVPAVCKNTGSVCKGICIHNLNSFFIILYALDAGDRSENFTIPNFHSRLYVVKNSRTDKKTILKARNLEKFEKFIVKKTDLAWTHGMTFLTMNYKTWKYNQQNTKMKRSI